MSARSEILDKVRTALGAADRGSVAVLRDYRNRPQETDAVTLFVERVADYRAVVERCDAAQVEERIAAALPRGARVIMPAGLPWAVAGAAVDDGFSARALDAFEVTVTGAALGIAETGTVVLTHGSTDGRRAISLVPDMHVCVVHAADIVADVPEAFAVLGRQQVTTWISGPSATSDIELNRVEGVHGPRRLHVIVVNESQDDGGV